MPIAMKSGRGHGGGDLFGRRGAVSAGWGSDSRVGMVRSEEDTAEEESDGEVQSSYRGRHPLDTMEALQHALPRSRSRSSSSRRGATKVDNINSSSLMSAEDAVVSSQHTKDPAIPEDPSPKKRKGLLPCSVDQDSEELNPVDDATNSPTNCRKALYPTVTDISPGKNKGYDEHKCCKNLLNTIDAFASPPTALLPELASVQTKFVAISLSDVAELTDVISPSEKRRKN